MPVVNALIVGIISANIAIVIDFFDMFIAECGSIHFDVIGPQSYRIR